MSFELLARDGEARAGLFHTLHGPVETPAFFPVATQATAKGLTPHELRRVGVAGLLVNAYHLWQRPGPRLIEQAGGLHHFMAWDGAIITDSGGYQVFSLAEMALTDEAGVTFRSHFDGREFRLTPNLAVEMQTALGADVCMVLDICARYPVTLDTLREATERTVRWADQSLSVPRDGGAQLFAIVQGGTDAGLRRWCAGQLAGLPFDGYGIGGLSVGEPREATWPALETSLEILPEDRTRYLMGVGAPADLLEGIARGVDVFDCVLPTRLGRHGSVLTRQGRANLRGASWAEQRGPIEPECDCPACSTVPAGVVHHLLRSGDGLGRTLASLHNIRFLVNLVQGARNAIVDGRFSDFREQWLADAILDQAPS